MNPERWERARAIFDDAVDLSPDERAPFLRAACEDDPELLREVEGMLAADDAAGSFLSQGWAASLVSPEFTLAPGDIVCNRFRIDRPLGAGGMGRVYQAYDTELGVAIALKVLRPEIARDPELLRRFRQEVRIAHRITHPNVCRTFHLDRETRGAEQITFLTMEFLQGETLQQLLARTGALEQNEALAIARQMAEAINAAHKTGIVHRDIKPANVMVCPPLPGDSGGTRAVITDFGLARLRSDSVAREESTISVPGRVMGTLAYMAPEQLEAGEATPATDIYAFGLVLFEMVTGVKAFQNSQTLASAYARTKEPAPSARALVPSLPPEWDAAIGCCLQAEPDARPDSAAEVIALLTKETRPPRRRASLPTRWIWPAAILLFVVSLLGWALRTYGWQPKSAVADGALVYLAPAENRSGAKSLDNVTELLRASLSQSAHIRLLNTEKAGDLLQQMGRSAESKLDPATAREVAMRAGAVRVLFVTLRTDGGRTRMDVDLQQPDNSPARYRNHWTQTYSWPSSVNDGAELSQDLMTNVRAAGNWVRQKVGESSSDIAKLDTPPEDVTTRNWEALADFTEAEKLSAADRQEDASILLKKAVALDPGFALAWGRLGGNLFGLDRTDEGFAAYSHALDESLSNRLTRRERDLIAGNYAVDTLDFSAAEEAFRDCSTYYPADRDCLHARLYPLLMLGRMDAAISLIHRLMASGLLPNGAPLMLAYNHILQNDLASARQDVDALKNAGHLSDAAYAGGHIAFLEHRYADAEAGFLTMQKLATDQYDKSESYTLLANLAAEQGHEEKAEQWLQAGISLDRAQGLRHGEAFKHLDIAYLKCRAGRAAACLAEVDAALDLNTAPDILLRATLVLGQVNHDGQPRAALVPMLHRLGGKIPSAANIVVYDLARHSVAAELALAEGRPDLAITERRAADVLDSPITDREGLARAYVAAAAKGKSADDKQRMLKKAAEQYERITTRPQAVWYAAQRYPPGFFADELKDELALPPGAGTDHREKLQQSYAALRSIH